MTASAIDFIAQQQPTLTQLFEAQVLKTPDDIALLFEDADGTQQQLTYRELNQQANQLAQQIRARYQQEHQQPMAADTLIALYLDRSLAMVISILAVLKAGAAYVPVSPNYPQQRSQYIFNDAGAAIILTQTKHLTMVADGLAGEPIVLAVDSPQLNYQKDGFKDNLACYSSANDLAYVIYTSGTTGQPKGVMLAHRGAVNMVQSLAQIYGVDDCQRALLFSEYVFDASVFELFVALTQGLSLYLANDNQRKNVLVLQQLITAQKIELLPLTPAVLSLISNDTLSSVKVVVIGGETPPQVLLERVAQHTRLFNAYGPTETSVCVSCHRFHHGDDAANIGTAINNTQLVILNDQLVPVADGEAGELYIGGAGLARGYLHQPQLTAARFIPNPLATEQDIQQGFSRLYKSGDMVRRLPTGDLQFLGRNDDQLKIRGFRVELAEIESVLSGLDGVNQVVVLALEHAGQPMLVAYLVLDKTLEKADNSSITPASLKAAAQEILAEYMVPASFNVIDKMPLTINGKVDKNGLAPPVWLDEAGYVAPCNALEQQLCVILQQLLGLEQVGIDDDFFQLGINSLLASALIIKLNEADTNSLQAADIFANSTVAKLAEKINQTVSQAPDNQQPLAFFSGPRPDFIPLSYQNQQIWFLQQFDHHIRAYNCQFKLCLKGPLAIDRLQQTLDIIIERHEIYRTVFVEVDGQPGQLVLPPWQAAIKQFDLSDRDSAQQKGFIADFIDQQGNDCFDIGQLPLLRWTLFKKSQYEYELVQFE
ncbi:MAG: amino acid adenylation domain-containing protein, partial [Phenylobacterium sp.]